MEAVFHHIEVNRATVRERLRLLAGTGDRRPPVGSALMVALARPLAESGLMVQSPLRPGRPLVASGGDPGRPHVVLLFHLVDPAEGFASARPGLIAALAALAAIRGAGQNLDLNLTFICVQDRGRDAAELAALGLAPVAVCLWDGGGYAGDRPWLALGSHGLLHLRLGATGPGGPVSMGSVLPNPAWRLVWALGALKSSSEEINVPEMYDLVREPTLEEMEVLEDVAPAMAEALTNERGELLHGVRPEMVSLVQSFSPGITLTGLGVESVSGQLPDLAWADIALSLVPDQTPERVTEAVKTYLAAVGLGDIKVEVQDGFGGQRTLPDSPVVRLVSKLATEALGQEPLLLPYGEAASPLSLLNTAGEVATLGMGTGRASVRSLEERVLRQARLVASLLLRLPEVLGGAVELSA